MSAYDICTCGDYRKEHDPHDPKQRCRICARGKAPWDICGGFAIQHHKRDVPEPPPVTVRAEGSDATTEETA